MVDAHNLDEAGRADVGEVAGHVSAGDETVRADDDRLILDRDDDVHLAADQTRLAAVRVVADVDAACDRGRARIAQVDDDETAGVLRGRKLARDRTIDPHRDVGVVAEDADGDGLAAHRDRRNLTRTVRVANVDDADLLRACVRVDEERAVLGDVDDLGDAAGDVEAGDRAEAPDRIAVELRRALRVEFDGGKLRKRRGREQRQRERAEGSELHSSLLMRVTRAADATTRRGTLERSMKNRRGSRERSMQIGSLAAPLRVLQQAARQRALLNLTARIAARDAPSRGG